MTILLHHCMLLLTVNLVLFSACTTAALTTGQFVRKRDDDLANERALPMSMVRTRELKPVILGDNGHPSSVFPLGKCEGDCDSDEDCEGSLVCFQRDAGQSSVPGCGSTSSSDTKDYCIDPQDSAPASGSFRLKLYWEPGYYWQQETIERKWCMRCVGTTCNDGDKIHIHKCDDSSTQFVFQNLSGDTTQVKVADQDLCLQLVSTNTIELRPCDSSKKHQKFRSGLGSFTGSRFELQTIINQGCLTQPHHPKDGEEVSRWDCEIPRDDTTNFWNRY